MYTFQVVNDYEDEGGTFFTLQLLMDAVQFIINIITLH